MIFTVRKGTFISLPVLVRQSLYQSTKVKFLSLGNQLLMNSLLEAVYSTKINHRKRQTPGEYVGSGQLYTLLTIYSTYTEGRSTK
jgi:hypothetical protein